MLYLCIKFYRMLLAFYRFYNYVCILDCVSPGVATRSWHPRRWTRSMRTRPVQLLVSTRLAWTTSCTELATPRSWPKPTLNTTHPQHHPPNYLKFSHPIWLISRFVPSDIFPASCNWRNNGCYCNMFFSCIYLTSYPYLLPSSILTITAISTKKLSHVVTLFLTSYHCNNWISGPTAYLYLNNYF